jgi:uncharacterized tellurite resistance protein B-like protein
MREELIVDLLMGAAHADQQADGNEIEAVKRLVCQLSGAPKLSPRLEKRVAEFDPAKFDVAVTVSKLRLRTDVEKRKLIELVAAVEQADDILDLAEDAYLRKVAGALGMPASAYADLTLDVIDIDDIRSSLLPTPPPLPGSKPPPLPT